MPDYQKSLALARRLIQGSGRSVTFLKLGGTRSDPAKPWIGSTTPAEPRTTPLESVTAFATFVPLSSASLLGIRSDQIGFFKTSQQVALVESPSLVSDLREFQELLDGDIRWKVQAVQELKPGDTTLLYWVGVAR